MRQCSNTHHAQGGAGPQTRRAAGGCTAPRGAPWRSAPPMGWLGMRDSKRECDCWSEGQGRRCAPCGRLACMQTGQGRKQGAGTVGWWARQAGRLLLEPPGSGCPLGKNCRRRRRLSSAEEGFACVGGEMRRVPGFLTWVGWERRGHAFGMHVSNCVARRAGRAGEVASAGLARRWRDQSWRAAQGGKLGNWDAPHLAAQASGHGGQPLAAGADG